MREIKFRGIQKTTGSWIYGDLMHDTEGGCYIYPMDSVGLYAANIVVATTVGEFTGLRDKNGKEIYEGDIVCITDNENDDSSNSEVKFRNGVFGVENWTKKCLTTLNFFMLDSNNDEQEYSIEVVGNIYDNRELLKEG